MANHDRKNGLREQPIVSIKGNRKTTIQDLTINVYPEMEAHTPIYASNLPPRNKYFTGRIEVLDALTQGFADGSGIVLTQAISGLGGVGKTQTAIEFAYLHKDEYADAVWWVKSENSPLDDCRKLLEWFGFPSDVNDEEKLQFALAKWYHDHDSWLLIFDNAEDNAKLEKWLPKAANGRVLITTRDKNAFHAYAKQINLDVIPTEDALLFLEKRTGRSVDTAAEKLAQQLGYFPLALEQAGSFMYETGKTYAQYLALLERQDLRVFEEEELGKPVYYEHIVTTTWQISTAKLSREANQLLKMCAYLAPDNIPMQIFFDAVNCLPQLLQSKLADELKRDGPIAELVKYSFLKISDEEKGLYSMHRLVQKVIRRDIGSDISYLSADLDVVIAALPENYSSIDAFSQFASLSEHAAAVINYAIDYAGEYSGAPLAKMNRLHRFFLNHSAYISSDPITTFERYVSLLERQYAHDSEECTVLCADTRRVVGDLLRRKGRSKEALRYYVEAQNILDSRYGLESAHLFLSLGNYYRGFDVKKSEECYNKALGIYEENNNAIGMANVYQGIGALESRRCSFLAVFEAYDKALEKYRIANDLYGMGYTTLRIGINKLLLQQPGALDEAFSDFQDAQEYFKKTDNPLCVSDVYIYLSGYWRRKGRLEAAVSVLSDAQKEYEKYNDFVGLAHVNLRFGLVYLEQADSRCKDCFVFAIHHFPDSLGKGNAYQGLAEYYSTIGENADALEHFMLAKSEFEKAEDRIGLKNVLKRLIDYGVENSESMKDTVRQIEEELQAKNPSLDCNKILQGRGALQNHSIQS